MGRRTKNTPERIDKLCGFISTGSSKKDACHLVGIDPSTLCRWLPPENKEGDEGKKGTKEQQELQARIDTAESGYKATHLGIIANAATQPSKVTKVHIREMPDGTKLKDITEETRPPLWTASAWLLERGYPAEFGRRIEHAGEVSSGPAPIINVVFSDEPEGDENGKSEA